jgi:hypothetical protein
MLFFIVFIVYFSCMMSRLHTLEFKKHWAKYTWLTLPFIAFLAAEIYILYMTFLLGKGDESYITFFFSNLWRCIVITSLVEISPYLIFLAVNTVYKPHDCFKCFGKDPERKFSIYQYTKDEK